MKHKYDNEKKIKIIEFQKVLLEDTEFPGIFYCKFCESHSWHAKINGEWVCYHGIKDVISA